MKGLLFLTALAAFFSRATFGEINITLLSAPEGPVSQSAIVAVNAYIQSTALIDSVSAKIGPMEFPLERTSGSEDNGNYVSTWARNFRLPELPDGPTNLTIRAQAAGGESSVTNRAIIVTSPPTLIVTEPFEGLVLHSGRRLPIKATAFDEDSDVLITAQAEFAVVRTNQIDTAVPVTRSGRLTISAEGNYNQVTRRTFDFILQPNPKLERVADVPGVILDVDSNRILYQRDEAIYITEVGGESGGPLAYQSTNEWAIRNALLTPEGVIVVEQHTRSNTYRSFEIVGENEIISLGLTRNSRPQVSGNYAAWAGATNELIRRDLIARVNVEITNTLSPDEHSFSLAANGDVSFSESQSGRIFRYRGNSIEQISTTSGHNNWTDGTNILYAQERENSGGQPHPILLYTPGGTVLLGVNSFYRRPYLNNGWVAYHHQGRLLLRSGSGTLQERTGGTVLALNSQGELLIKGSTVVLSKSAGSTIDYGNFEGRPIYRNNQWEVILGNTLFRLRENFDNLMIIHQNGPILDVRFIGIPGETYQIQMTPYLDPPIFWTLYRAPQEADANGSIGFLEIGPGTNRYYRAVQVSP